MNIERVDNTVWRLWRVRKTLFQMCYDRGYLVSQTELDMTLEEFRAHHGDDPQRSELTIFVANKDDVANKLYVFFPEDDKIGVGPIKTYFERMQTESVYRAIVVVKSGITPMAKSHMSKIPKYNMEMFLESELLVNIMEHELVPKHVILTDEEKGEVLKHYKVRETQLPRMQRNDPVARYFGLVRGQ
eukprot:Ihof_evm3s208 gene=Ihof_evmTU3s208